MDVDLYPDRWSETQCWVVVRNSGWEALHLMGVPVDYSGMLKTKKEVPYGPKVLARMCKKYSSASPEFAPRSKSNANYAHQNLAQRFPAMCVKATRQSPPLPFESGIRVLPGMERFISLQDRRVMAGFAEYQGGEE